MNLSDIVSSVFSGGLTGLVGVAIQRVYEYKSKQLDIEMLQKKFSHEIDLKKADAEIMQQEWAARTKVAQVEAESKENVADSQSFSQALTSEPQRYSNPGRLDGTQEWMMVCLDVIRGLIRPGLTIYLSVLTTLIYFQAEGLLGKQSVTLEQASSLLNRIIDTVLYLTTTCTLFWFGSRNREKRSNV